MRMRREIHRRIRKKLEGVDLSSDVDAVFAINVGDAAAQTETEDARDDTGPKPGERTPPEQQEAR
jgi:hypothetical protein